MFGVAFAIAVRMIWVEERRAALGVLLAFTAYLRPGELTSLTMRQLLPPGAFEDEGHRHWVRLLNPSGEGADPSKTGRYDDSVILDDTRSGALYKQLGILKWQLHPTETLIGMPHQRWVALFATA